MPNKEKPIGSEHKTKDGAIVVKVAMHPTKPGSKDNWVNKKKYVWEKANNKKLPEGWIILFCNHDKTDYSPENLFAVPRKYHFVMNKIGEWHDRETCKTVYAMAKLKVKINDAALKVPLTCNKCGKKFYRENNGRDRYKDHRKLCPECRRQFFIDTNRVGHGFGKNTLIQDKEIDDAL